MSVAYVEYHEDHKGDLMDISHFCERCAPDEILPWPAYDWPEYDVYCDSCEEMVHKHEE